MATETQTGQTCHATVVGQAHDVFSKSTFELHNKAKEDMCTLAGIRQEMAKQERKLEELQEKVVELTQQLENANQSLVTAEKLQELKITYLNQVKILEEHRNEVDALKKQTLNDKSSQYIQLAYILEKQSEELLSEITKKELKNACSPAELDEMKRKYFDFVCQAKQAHDEKNTYYAHMAELNESLKRANQLTATLSKQLDSSKFAYQIMKKSREDDLLNIEELTKSLATAKQKLADYETKNHIISDQEMCQIRLQQIAKMRDMLKKLNTTLDEQDQSLKQFM